MVKRYSTDTEAFDDKYGLYVLHTDYVALLEAARLLVEAMEEPKAYESAMNNPIAKALLEGREL